MRAWRAPCMRDAAARTTAMSHEHSPTSDVAFTRTVKSIQQRKGSRAAYARLEANGGWETRITPELAEFIAAQRSFFLATASAEGQPYIQHRGGPPGFLKVVDDRTLGFVDFKGNRQFITQGNLADNERAFIFLIDFATRRRVKLWGTARVVEDDAALLRLVNYIHLDPVRAKIVTPEQAAAFR